MLRIKSSTLFLMFLLFVLPASGQAANQSEISLNFSGNVQAQAKGLGVTDTASDTSGFLANYRYRFSRWGAIEVNYGYSRFSQHYTPAITTTQANVDELTLAYVNTLGRPANNRLGPFVEAGTGALIFSPVSAGSTVGAIRQSRAVFLFGGGIDWHAVQHISLRLGFRGLVYQAPDFLIAGQQTTNAVTTMAEPYVGVVFRF
ncbi:MAG TPA: outer membrane beta-barrel protein [Candidatus Acidoferrales bacterium]|jgi:opacity protein-like surface antigen|nr:outer membrane beta-barrel protein [Candidatus Acidoferrales bacterium]